MDIRQEPKAHVPLLSAWCTGPTCTTCPRLWKYFVTGADLSRHPRDNATFLCAATEDYRGRPYEKLTRARWQRLARRHAFLTVPAALEIVDLIGPDWPVELYTVAAPTAVTAWAGYKGVTVARNRRTYSQYVDPAARALYAQVGAKYRKRPGRQNVIIPRGWRPGEGSDPVRLVIPTDKPLTATQERQVVTAIGGRLGINNAKGSWLRTGEAVTVDITGEPLPPKEVTYAQVKQLILDAPPHRPLVGMGPGGPVYLDYEQDSPHVACSGPSGTGKSTLFRLIAAQRMRHGHGALFLDAKRWSHEWAHDLPRTVCQYAYRPADIHDALVALGEEVERRIDLPTREELEQQRTYDIYVEEINSLIKLLTFHWKGRRKEIIEAAKELKEMEADYDPADLDPPALSPAVAALQYAVFMGRELRIHVHVMSQKLEANVFGSNSGGAVRDSFQIRLMAKWDRKLWKMLCDGLEFVAWPGGQRGLWGANVADEFRLFRVPQLSNAEAIELATMSTGAGVDTAEVSSGQARGQLVTLAKAVDSGQLPGRPTLEALRMAKKKDPRFPDPMVVGGRGRADLYDLEALISWQQVREVTVN